MIDLLDESCLFFCIESAIDLETIKQSYSNAVNELNQELLAMKEAYEQADAEKQFLISELDKRPVDLDREQGTGNFYSFS